MSKLNRAKTEDLLNTMLDYSKTKQRKFVESIELQIGLRNYDPSRDKRFSGTIKLPFVCKPRMKICVIADAATVEKCEALRIPHVTAADIKLLNKNKKEVTKLAKKYDAFLCSESILKTLPRIAGPWFTKANKFPTMLTAQDDLNGKCEEIKSTIKFQMKKVLCMNACIGDVTMEMDDVYQNVVTAVNFLISLLKKNWQNIKSINVKSTMGPPQLLF